MYRYDVVIAGAGIIGLTLAREILLRSPKIKLLILEKEPYIGAHASGRNSGVLHTGIYYPSHTLKAKFCKQGADKLFDYAITNKIPVKKNGKVIVARSEENAKGLAALIQNAKESNISAELLDEAGIKAIEPFAYAEHGGIYCKDTAVIDNKKVLSCLEEELIKLGAKFQYNVSVLDAEVTKDKIVTSQGCINYGYFINATGAFSDKVAKLFNIAQEYKLVPFKGMYYKFKKEHAHKVNGSIYPVPDPSLPFLGIHFTRVINDDVYIGPTAIPALGRENYNSLKGIDVSESLSILMSLSRLYFKDIQNFRSLVKKELPHLISSGFYKSSASLMSGIDASWLEKNSKVGIRPQLINTQKNRLEMDFLVEFSGNTMHVLNSISPAFTSSFAVAEYLVNKIDI